MNKLQKSAPQGQYRLAQGSALGWKVNNQTAPCKGSTFKTPGDKDFALTGRRSLAALYPGRCPGLGDDWPYRPLNTTSENSIKNKYK